MNVHFKRGLLSPLSVLDPQTGKRMTHLRQERLSDAEALRSDWQKVGDSLRSAMNRANTQPHTRGK